MRLERCNFARTLPLVNVPMHLVQALAASEIKTFFFDWYPVFGVLFMFCLLIVFVTMTSRRGRA